MELLKVNSDYFATVQKQGNDRSGNGIYKINIFAIYFATGSITNDTHAIAKVTNSRVDKDSQIIKKGYKHEMLNNVKSLINAYEEYLRNKKNI
jgi:hypothetical protein